MPEQKGRCLRSSNTPGLPKVAGVTNGASTLNNAIVAPLNAPKSTLYGGLNKQPLLYVPAREAGLAQAKQPGACHYFKEHPEAVDAIRAAVQAVFLSHIPR